MSLVVWPATHKTMTEHAWSMVWDAMVSTGRAESVFYDDMPSGWEDFAARVCGGIGLFVFDTASKKWVFASWFDARPDGWADAHFCGLSKFKYEYAKMCVANAKHFGFHGLLGTISDDNKIAQKMVKKLGWSVVGSVPELLNTRSGRRSATIYYTKL